MVSVVFKFHLKVDFIRSLAHYSDFLFSLAVSRSDSSNCHERDGNCTDDTSPYARMRTFYLFAHFTREHTCDSRPKDLTICL